jgi:hypothetical protein
MNTELERRLLSLPQVTLCRKQREYNFIQTHIKGMTNFVNLAFNSQRKRNHGRLNMVGENFFTESPKDASSEILMYHKENTFSNEDK